MRAFFCIPIPGQHSLALQHIADRLCSATDMRASWVPQQNYHITLRFLGNIDPELVTDLEKLSRDLGERIAPFQCVLDRVGAFPTTENARILWVGGAMPQTFQMLTEGLALDLINLGFPQARRDSIVHVTLARIKHRPDSALANVIAELNPIKPIAPMIDQIVLMESALTGRGPVYTPLFETKLAG